MNVTNISAGPRGLNAKSGPVLLEPGQSIEIEISEAELKVSGDTGWFKFVGEPVSSDQGENLDRDELKKQADELGIEYPSNVKTAKLKELIDAKLAE